MSKHPKTHKRQGYLLRKEYPPNIHRHIGKCVSNTAYDHILKRCCFLNEWCLLFLVCEDSFLDKLVWELYCCRRPWLDYLFCGRLEAHGLRISLPREGSACITQMDVVKRPTWMISWGVRKTKKTMQSTSRICPRIMFGRWIPENDCLLRESDKRRYANLNGSWI